MQGVVNTISGGITSAWWDVFPGKESIDAIESISRPQIREDQRFPARFAGQEVRQPHRLSVFISRIFSSLKGVSRLQTKVRNGRNVWY